MTATQLIFVEGIPGVGKSTTAEKLADHLEQHGRPARFYHEMADDNPIRTRGMDAMRLTHPSLRPLAGTGPDGFALDPSVYDVEQWGKLAARCTAGRESVVLDARYIQNSVQPRFLSGAPEAKVIEGFRSIHQQVRSADPLLVYLRLSDIRSRVLDMLDARGDPWRSWYLDRMTQIRWSRQRGVTGVDAVIAFNEAWEAVADRLFQQHSTRKLRVTDPQDDWSGALDRIYRAALPG